MPSPCRSVCSDEWWNRFPLRALDLRIGRPKELGLPMNANPDQMPQPARSQHAVIALVIAGLLIFLARQAADSLFPPQPGSPDPALSTSAAALPAIAQESTPIAEEEDAAALQASQERNAREKQLAEQSRLRREQKLQEAIASRDQAAEMARLDQERIEQAWARFYKKPKKCDNANDQTVIVECGNHFIRERQRFEKLWTDGKIAVR